MVELAKAPPIHMNPDFTLYSGTAQGSETAVARGWRESGRLQAEFDMGDPLGQDAAEIRSRLEFMLASWKMPGSSTKVSSK